MTVDLAKPIRIKRNVGGALWESFWRNRPTVKFINHSFLTCLSIIATHNLKDFLMNNLVEFFGESNFVFGSALQSRTICGISIKNRQKFLEKSPKFLHSTPPCLTESWIFFYSRFVSSRRVSKNVDFSELFFLAHFPVSLSKFTFRIPQKKNRISGHSQNHQQKKIKKFVIRNYSRDFKISIFFVANEKKIEAILNDW